MRLNNAYGGRFMTKTDQHCTYAFGLENTRLRKFVNERLCTQMVQVHSIFGYCQIKGHQLVLSPMSLLMTQNGKTRLFNLDFDQLAEQKTLKVSLDVLSNCWRRKNSSKLNCFNSNQLEPESVNRFWRYCSVLVVQGVCC